MLKGLIKPADQYGEEDLSAMYRLMSAFYDDTDENTFRKDFGAKDYCLALYHESDGLVGFTTQKVMHVPVDGKEIHGIFSGDTIIHKEHWGDLELFRVWARFWFDFAAQYETFYWFLICKGYKTYCMLPLFFTEFYPTYRFPTPPYEQRIMNAYAESLYGKAYNYDTGVIEYPARKDKLKSGVADIGSRELRNKDIAYFTQANPGYRSGNDLVCLAKLDRTLLRKHAGKLLFT